MRSFAFDGISLHGKLETLVAVEQQSPFEELLQQGLDLSVPELNDLLLSLVCRAQECPELNVPWLEETYSALDMGQRSVPTGEFNSWKCNKPEPQNAMWSGVLSAAAFFDHPASLIDPYGGVGAVHETAADAWPAGN